MFHKVTTYREAIALIRQIGFLPLSRNPFGFPSLEDATAESSWHTGEESDPWIWKDRAAFEKQAAYARTMAKRLTFVSMDWYPTFISAYKSPLSVEERYEEGLLSSFARGIYRALHNERPLATHELKERLSIMKETNGAFDNAMSELQCSMDITVFGATRKRNKRGEPYGWLVSEYTTVAQWAPPDVLDAAVSVPRSDAIERIQARIRETAPHLSDRDVARMMGIRDLR